MKHASLLRLSVATTTEAEDAVAELLSGIFGITASTYSDAETEMSTVSVYFEQKLDSPYKIRQVLSAGLKGIRRCGLKVGPGKIVTTWMRREDWAESWKRHFKPIEIFARGSQVPHHRRPARDARARTANGLKSTFESLLIKPGWSKRRPRKGQTVLVLDPGLSFGTGHHPTTEYCLEQIVRVADSSSARLPASDTRTSRLRPSFLDIGTGSGILAIAAAKLGYSPVKAFDFDPEAVRTARANARLNRVGGKLDIWRRDVTKLPICPGQRGQQYDLVCANLNADLLIRQRQRVAGQLKCCGTLVLAGILKTEFAAVQMAYEGVGLKLISQRTVREWRSASLRIQC